MLPTAMRHPRRLTRCSLHSPDPSIDPMTLVARFAARSNACAAMLLAMITSPRHAEFRRERLYETNYSDSDTERR